MAVDGGHLDIAKLLVTNGAEVNKANNDKETPLHRAVKRGHLKVVDLLLENGANINESFIISIINPQGSETPASSAAKRKDPPGTGGSGKKPRMGPGPSPNGNEGSALGGDAAQRRI